MGKNKHGKRKQYLNNVDVPLSKTDANVIKPSITGTVLPAPPKSILKPTVVTNGPQQPQISSSGASSSGTKKYKQPELHTTLGLSKKIEELRLKHPAAPIIGLNQLTPSSKKRVNTRISKKLNHRHDHAVFKKLAPVNVNDTVLLPSGGTLAEGNAKSKFLFKEKKDPEPTLSDYLRPIQPFTFDPQPIRPSPLPSCGLSENSWNNYENIQYVLGIIEEH
ncbi:uncharacterized protein LOC128723499 [Anopheles nili]|uniref:uncharacterized protein LOC128723499 n=1 Tax=Anopheles nili TaxID=185578 RepID=UPI00237B20CA|nr:uncharacterized protein LOC128723499 [Anopheles nili]